MTSVEPNYSHDRASRTPVLDLAQWRMRDFISPSEWTDSDFAVMRMHAESGPAIVWLRLGNIANDAPVAALEQALPEIVAAGEELIEVRKST